MLGILLIYFIGKQFYQLAEKHEKNQWGFAIAGVVSYYAGTFIAGIIIGVYFEFFSSSSIDDMSDIALGLAALPFGLLACFALYKILEKNWERPLASVNSDILDENLMD